MARGAGPESAESAAPSGSVDEAALAAILPGLLASIVDAAPVVVILVDASRRILLVNAAVEFLLGYSRCELLGNSLDRLVPSASRQAHTRWQAQFMQHPNSRLMGAGRDVSALHKDGSLVAVEIGLRVLQSEIGPLAVATLVDVRERIRLHELARQASESLEKRVHERTAELQHALRVNELLLSDLQAQRLALERLSREDPLTGLYNRREFERRLGDEIQRAARLSTPLSLAMFDIDHFKSVNDRFGHAVGDIVLQRIASLIRSRIRTIDVLARLGGEEFALIMPATRLEDAAISCERIRESFHAFEWNSIHPELSSPVTISIGLAGVSPEQDASGLMLEADRHLYAAKHEGRDQVVHGDPVGSPGARAAD